MQSSVSHTTVAPLPLPLPPPPARAHCLARPRVSRAGGGGVPTTALRARCVGAVEPAEARDQDGCASGEDEVLAPEELEMLEDEAMGGGDEGRRPTDYDRRAHIFEASSRVFQAIKQRRDCDGSAEEAAVAATAGESTARDRHEPQRLE